MKNFLKKITELNQFYKKLILVILDSIIAITMLILAFSLRLGYFYWPSDDLLFFILCSPCFIIPIFFIFNLYKSVIRHIGFKALLSISQAITLYVALWGLIGYMISITTEFGLIPRSIIFINWMLCILTIIGSRLFAQWLFSSINKSVKNIIIYGAGSSGIQLSNALKLSNEYIHVAYIDDDINQRGRFLNSIPVFPSKELSMLTKKYKTQQVLLAMPSISRKKRQKIINDLSKLNINAKDIPSFLDVAEGKVKINDLLQVDARDLLGREEANPDKTLLKLKIKDKVVLVTGAGGSIGSELCRQIVSLNPKMLILYEISESALYQIESELNDLSKLKNITLIPVLGSILNYKKLKTIFNAYKVQTIYHAAAYKHVPMVEFNQSEGVLNNVIGTMECAKAAIDSYVETFVLISTDKAVRPTNTMGASKRIAELILQGLAMEKHNTCFTMVRFGNVLNSSGSVIPLFKKQIDLGGPITVTHRDVVRYFMTIPEAVELVIQAGAMAEGGDVFLLNMGEPVKIYDLAVKMINLSGLKVMNNDFPDGDIEIIFTGLRPGEKLYEELLIGNNTIDTNHDLIFRAEEHMINWNKLKVDLVDLHEACDSFQQKRVRELLIKIVPEFDPESPILDVLFEK